MRTWDITSFPQLCSQIANGKLRPGTPAQRHSTGSAAAYATQKAGSGRCTISAPRATRRCGIPHSSANAAPTEALLLFDSWCILDRHTHGAMYVIHL